MRLAVLAPFALLGACATGNYVGEAPSRAEQAANRLLEGKVAGSPVASISRFEAQRMSVFDGYVLFRVNRDLIYRNDLQGCSLVREDDILQLNLYGSDRLSRGDIAQIISRAGNFGKGACPLGDFVPYRTPPR